MNPELEAILKAFDAVLFSSGSETQKLKAIYESRLEDVLSRHPNLSREKLEATIRYAYLKWLKAEKKPTSLPPKA